VIGKYTQPVQIVVLEPLAAEEGDDPEHLGAKHSGCPAELWMPSASAHSGCISQSLEPRCNSKGSLRCVGRGYVDLNNNDATTYWSKDSASHPSIA
jgi:hypothetical protein